jgi:hypothetical protein
MDMAHLPRSLDVMVVVGSLARSHHHSASRRRLQTPLQPGGKVSGSGAALCEVLHTGGGFLRQRPSFRGARFRANPESKRASFKGWIPGSGLRPAPE